MANLEYEGGEVSVKIEEGTGISLFTDKLLLHGFIACGLPEERGLERVAHLVAPAVRDGIDQPVIFPSAHVTPRFLHRQVIDGKERTVFAHRLETVLPIQSLHGVAYLLLHITCPSTDTEASNVYSAGSPQPLGIHKCGCSTVTGREI